MAPSVGELTCKFSLMLPRVRWILKIPSVYALGPGGKKVQGVLVGPHPDVQFCLEARMVSKTRSWRTMSNIWVPLSGQIAQQRKVETIANNVANANTPGFKKDQLVFKEHLTVLNSGSDSIQIHLK